MVFPAKALPVERGELAKLLTECPPENRQEVLDEVEGAARRNALRAGIVPFGRYLVSAIENGRFAPSLGVQVRAEREAAAEAEARKIAAARAMAAEAPAMTDADAARLPVELRQQLLALRMRAAERTPSSMRLATCAEGPARKVGVEAGHDDLVAIGRQTVCHLGHLIAEELDLVDRDDLGRRGHDGGDDVIRGCDRDRIEARPRA